ncbi:hypothetical protein D6D05_09824 [Aureobasidium pullulans]|nr:hypothetical protein D6D05_09824 [Aureobasidium pullulans]
MNYFNGPPMHQHQVGPEDNIYIFIREQGEAHDGITWRPDIGILDQLGVLLTRLTQFALATQLEHCFHPEGQECNQELSVQRQGRCRDGAELRRPDNWMAACRSCWSAFVCLGQKFDFHQNCFVPHPTTIRPSSADCPGSWKPRRLT